ncbi:MAG: oligosaccharide flippase family protein [Rhodoferax sp.]|nr:oligosaccharide flippase family protein [Rhodoferax sp.]
MVTHLPGASLRARMLRAAGWLVGGNVSSQALRLVSNLILTRLLVPEAFGLVAAVNTLYFALVMFSDLGVWQSVVKSPHGLEPRFLGTAWTVQLLRAVLLASVVLSIAAGLHLGAGAGYFASGTVYADPRLPPMVALFAVCALLQGLESMKLACAQRELKVAHLARLELLSQVIATLVTVGLALATHSVWSMLVGTLVASGMKTALSHLYLPGPSARPSWDRNCAAEIIGFGKWIFLSSIIGFLAAHGEKLILGGTLSTASFGIFSIANTLLLALLGVYSAVNGHILFSALSEAERTDAQQAARVTTRVQQLADVLLGLMAGGIFVAGHWVVLWFYDARYQQAGWMFQWLGLSLLAIRHQVVEQLMFARGQPAWVTASNALRALSLVLLVPAAYAWGGERGAIAAVVASQFVSWPVALWFKARNGLLTWKSEAVWLPALAAGMLLGWLLDQSLRSIFK